MAKKKHPEGRQVKSDHEYRAEDSSGNINQPDAVVDEEKWATDGSQVKDETVGGGADTVNETPVELELQEKLAEMQDKYLRLSAEFDNYRKRTLKEKIDLTKTAAESVLIKLLPVLDDFERGLKVMETATDCSALKQGIDLIYSKFRNFLDQNGVKEIDAINNDFDVNLHDAVTKVPVPEKDLSGKVVDVIQKGYLLNDKVIRFSKVVVGE
ncbi:MAG: nucleotide exchange factor GrpE [Bacteroidales bacterium]|jgi:molecular chaperone GrpE|nr:nucleotide exchange factor GrpE [Bacteroidales bacterium]